MMKMTATVQATFDYESEEDAVDRMRTAFGVTSIVTALFAASPLVDGRPGPDRSFRAAVWLETDPHRCGLLPFAFEPDFSFSPLCRVGAGHPDVVHRARRFVFRHAIVGWPQRPSE